MSLLKKYTWEVTHITSIVGVITTLTLAAHLGGTPHVEAPPGEPSTTSGPKPMASFPLLLTPQSDPAAHPVQAASQHNAARPQPSDPREITVGPSEISNRYTLLSVARKPISSTTDELIVSLHVESLATENLVSPFESDMLQISSPDLEPINPKTRFHHPIPSGNSLTQNVVFSIPTRLSLNHTTLQIHYYNDQNEIPLNLPPHLPR